MSFRDPLGIAGGGGGGAARRQAPYIMGPTRTHNGPIMSIDGPTMDP